MSSNFVDRKAAQTFVESLFRTVLNRTEIGEVELNYWTDRAFTHTSVADIFFEFANSTERKGNTKKQILTNTMYPAGHFYSPVVNLDEVNRDMARIFSYKNLKGIDLNTQNQRELFDFLVPIMRIIPFSDKPNHDFHYHYDNTSFGFGDACIYWSILGHFAPRQIIEVGSGFTSALAVDAIDCFNLSTQCTFIDPYPSLVKSLVGPRGKNHSIIEQCVQDLSLDHLDALEANDFLFLDSSHVVKTGSDVHHEITEMLPRLKSGVIIHFHDIFYPFEYPKPWVMRDNRSWNELYMVQAFLLFNTEFEIIFFNDFFIKTQADKLEVLEKKTADRLKINPGGGLWLRRR